MENKNNNNTKANTQNQNTNAHTGRQGFASMPHDKVVEIASMGGHASHKNTNSKTEENKTSGNQNKGSHTTSRSGR